MKSLSTIMLAVLALVVSIISTSTTAAASVQRPSISTWHFASSFAPQDAVAVAGSVWVLGSAGSRSSGQCELDEIGPALVSQRLYPLPACAVGMTAGDGMIYLEVQQGLAGSNIRQIHVEAFDLTSDTATVMAPVVMGIVGSGIAHTDFSFGEGSLWLYGYDQDSGGPAVVRIAPTTGQPLQTVTSVPAIGGVYPSVVADAVGAWFAGGPGGSPDLGELPSGSATTRTVYAGPTRSAILWASTVHGSLWADVATYGSGPKPSVRSHLVAVHGSAATTRGPAQDADLFPLVGTSDGRLWTLSFPNQCLRGSAQVVGVDATTGAARGVVRLPISASAACEGAAASESEVLSTDHDVFVLVPLGAAGESVLYRIQV
jgi:hypothetical protein